MKLSNFTQAVVLMLLIAFAASCGTSHPTSRYPDRRDYPDRYPHDERATHRLPPGHAKKVYGHGSAKSHAPGQRKKYGYRSLIIVRRPGMDIRRMRDGRYYYTSSEGFYYWKGYDDRLYIDERHLSQIDYDRNSYEDWKARGRDNARRYKHRR